MILTGNIIFDCFSLCYTALNTKPDQLQLTMRTRIRPLHLKSDLQQVCGVITIDDVCGVLFSLAGYSANLRYWTSSSSARPVTVLAYFEVSPGSILHSITNSVLNIACGTKNQWQTAQSTVVKCTYKPSQSSDSSGAVWESRWTSWAVRPNEPSGFRGRKELLNHASALVTTCP